MCMNSPDHHNLSGRMQHAKSKRRKTGVWKSAEQAMHVGLFDHMVLSGIFLVLPGPGLIGNPAVRRIHEDTLCGLCPRAAFRPEASTWNCRRAGQPHSLQIRLAAGKTGHRTTFDFRRRIAGIRSKKRIHARLGTYARARQRAP